MLFCLTNSVDVEFCQNFDVECRQKAGKIGDLYFVNFANLVKAI